MSTSTNSLLILPTTAFAAANWVVLGGREAIASKQGLLALLASRSSQPGAADYLDFFMAQPQMSGKMPHLMLLTTSPDIKPSEIRVSEVLGAVLVHEYRVAGLPMNVFVTDDYAGERNVIAPPEIRSAVALHAAAHLLSRGAHLVAASLRDASFQCDPSPGSPEQIAGAKWTAFPRTLTCRLPLEGSYDATLAMLGAHTRRNLRYYRKRVEEQLGCEFVTEAKIGEEQFIALSRRCSYPTSDSVSRFRFRTTHAIPGGFFAGIRSRDGDWLSIAGGRQYHRTTALDWQINQTKFAKLSLSTVMRSYLIQYAIDVGSTTLLFVGGTPHSMKHSFPAHQVVDLIVSRGTLHAKLLRRFAGTILPEENFVARVLCQPDLLWRTF